MKPRFLLFSAGLLVLSSLGCIPPAIAVPPAPLASTGFPSPTLASPSPAAGPTVPASPTPIPLVPEFRHIIIIVFENKEFGTVIANPQMPYFNQLASAYTLLTQFYAVTHPSLPNYLAMIGGDTFGVNFDCTDCLYDAPTLPDLIEQSGRTWRAYQEDLPSPCYAGADYGNYAMKHNPFMYFKAIRLNEGRCTRSVVPLTQLPVDLASGALPDFAFITPNLCNDAHDCDLDVADEWLRSQLTPLQSALDAEAAPYLIVLTWDEGQGKHSCCGLPAEAGGRIATVLVSPQVKNGLQDSTPYTHYSLLKTISESWHLPYLAHAADPDNVLITLPWK
jgi:phosphatidylinositol-3-phosphatase